MTPELKAIVPRLHEFISRSSSCIGIQPDLLEAEFNTLALELFAAQFAANGAYRRLAEARGVRPGVAEHWSRIPAVPAAAFKELELTCLGPAERTTVFHSSGTTEQRPSRHFHSADSLALYEASLWPWFERHVLAGVVMSEARLVILTPQPSAATNSSLVHMFETVRRHCSAEESAFLGGIGADGAWALDFARVEAALHAAVESCRPLVVLGTAFNFVHLLDELGARNVRLELPSGSVVMETGGYKGRSRELPKAELHQLITRMLGVPRAQIICEYGMSELSSQAYDGAAGSQSTTPYARCFRFPPWARAQLFSPETGREVADGETGLVRIFDLANTFSVFAVQTEDLATRRGTGFELLGRAAAAEPRGCSLMAQ
jgi:hypothetical protein